MWSVLNISKYDFQNQLNKDENAKMKTMITALDGLLTEATDGSKEARLKLGQLLNLKLKMLVHMKTMKKWGGHGRAYGGGHGGWHGDDDDFDSGEDFDLENDYYYEEGNEIFPFDYYGDDGYNYDKSNTHLGGGGKVYTQTV